MKHPAALDELLDIMARLRAPNGCPWDRQQSHRSLRYHAVEEVYELIDAIDDANDQDIEEELGDLLLQIVFHCQLGRERKAFDFDRVARRLVTKLIYRHPHVFGSAKVRTAAAVWAQWDRLKHDEKRGTRQERKSALDGIPRHLPALMRAQKLWKKARRAGLVSKPPPIDAKPNARPDSAETAKRLFALAAYAQERGWAAEDLLRRESRRRERTWRRHETARG